MDSKRRVNSLRLPRALGMAKLMRLQRSSSLFSMGVPESTNRWWDCSPRASWAVMLEGFLMYCPSSRITAPKRIWLRASPTVRSWL